MPEKWLITLVLAGPSPDSAAQYSPRTRTITVATATAAEDPRVVAGILAHEFRHALDCDLMRVNVVDVDCLELVARAYEAQAQIVRALYPGDLPTATNAELIQAALVREYEHLGIDGIRARLAGSDGYRRLCAAWRAP